MQKVLLRSLQRLIFPTFIPREVSKSAPVTLRPPPSLSLSTEHVISYRYCFIITDQLFESLLNIPAIMSKSVQMQVLFYMLLIFCLVDNCSSDVVVVEIRISCLALALLPDLVRFDFAFMGAFFFYITYLYPLMHTHLACLS